MSSCIVAGSGGAHEIDSVADEGCKSERVMAD